MVEQPPTNVPAAPVVQTNQPQANPATRRNTAPAAGFDAKQFGSACLNGALIVVGLFGVLGVIQAGRWGVKQYRRSQKQKQ